MIFMFQMDAGTGEKHADWDAYLKKRLAEADEDDTKNVSILLPHFIKPLISMDISQPPMFDEVMDDDGGDDYEEIYEDEE